MYAVKRTTVFLEDSVIDRANRYADKHGTSFASVVREALSAFLSESPERSRLPSIAGRYRSTDATNIAERAEELLWEDPHD